MHRVVAALALCACQATPHHTDKVFALGATSDHLVWQIVDLSLVIGDLTGHDTRTLAPRALFGQPIATTADAIYWLDDDPGGVAVWRADHDGSHAAIAVVTDEPRLRYALWTTDGTYLYYVDGPSLYERPLAGGPRTELATNSGAIGQLQVQSGVLFFSAGDGSAATTGIWRVDSDGSNLVQLVDGYVDHFAVDASGITWSTYAPCCDAFHANLDGTGPAQIATTPTEVTVSLLVADGRVAWTTSTLGDQVTIASMRLDGTAPRTDYTAAADDLTEFIGPVFAGGQLFAFQRDSAPYADTLPPFHLVAVPFPP
jgi:hypothetical protein